MKDENSTLGRYAGDAAWRDWFDICLVADAKSPRDLV